MWYIVVGISQTVVLNFPEILCLVPLPIFFKRESYHLGVLNKICL